MIVIEGGPYGSYHGDGSLIGINRKSEKMDKEITAKWARETSASVLSKKVEAELEECEQRIKLAVKENEMSTTIYTFYGQPKTVKELESRGFKVKQYDSQIDGASLTISW